MGYMDWVNYAVFDNPLTKSLVSVAKHSYSSIQPPALPPSPIVVNEKIPLYKLARENGPFVRMAGLMGASAVALGAYGAHRAYKTEEFKAIFETANRFHFFHTLALLGVPMCRYPVLSAGLLVTGTVLFTGPCYYHAFTGENKFGKFAPIGGTILIVSWLSMVL